MRRSAPAAVSAGTPFLLHKNFYIFFIKGVDKIKKQSYNIDRKEEESPMGK